MFASYVTQRVNTWISVACVASFALWAGMTIYSIAKDAETEFSSLSGGAKLERLLLEELEEEQ